jgi:hypothetical protein
MIQDRSHLYQWLQLSCKRSRRTSTLQCSSIALDGDQKCWSFSTHSVFWAERITVRKHMGCSLYFAITGAQPVIPLDIIEATYLQPPPDSILSTTNLIAQ